MRETVRARGHPNVTSRHRTTVEVTKEDWLTPRGDCILAVGSDMGCADLSEGFKEAARDENSVIEVRLSVDGIEERITGRGHPDLTFTHLTDMVIRKSDYICPRTLMISADKAAVDLDERLINLLKDKNQELLVEIEVKK